MIWVILSAVAAILSGAAAAGYFIAEQTLVGILWCVATASWTASAVLHGLSLRLRKKIENATCDASEKQASD